MLIKKVEKSEMLWKDKKQKNEMIYGDLTEEERKKKNKKYKKENLNEIDIRVDK